MVKVGRQFVRLYIAAMFHHGSLVVVCHYHHFFCQIFLLPSLLYHHHLSNTSPNSSLVLKQKPKSEVAAKAVQEMNPQIKITAHQNRLDPDSEGVYDYSFFMGLDGAAAALDNVEASEYTYSVFFATIILSFLCNSETVKQAHLQYTMLH